MEFRDLTSQERAVILDKGTEPPFSGKYVTHHADGTYTCKRCGAPLFSSNAKFDSGCGWPSFDAALPGAVRQVPDADGRRTEILCARCGGHLGHVFRGEGFTPRDTRHCVNSISIGFVPARAQDASAAVPGSDPVPAGTAEAEAFFAGGCFWGVEHLLAQQPGVLRAESGYMGGHTQSPTYEQVCSGATGHLETVRVVYDPRQVSYEQLAKLFFEIHDPTQVDRQGPDVGAQYGSAIFYGSAPERRTAEALVQRLRQQGLKVATRILPAGVFWRAEAYHQDYYARTGKQPYCHARVKRFP